jgi:4-amino-4-deoxy-L-arabinose transferase-like glycosyltransferase
MMMPPTMQGLSGKTFWVRALLLLIVLIGLYFRVDAVLKTRIDTPVRADARLYYVYGLNLLEHGTFSRQFPITQTPPQPDAFVAPVFPLAITPFLEFPPTDRMVVHIGLAQALLGACTIFLIYLLVIRAAGPVAALVAAALTAVSPHLISLTTYMLTETLFTFLMMAGLVSAAQAMHTGRLWLAGGAGLLLGLAALTRSTLEYFPWFLLAALALPLFRQMARAQWRSLLTLALTALAVLLAWKVRNLLSTGTFSDPSLMIATLQSGMYPDLTFEGHPESLGIPYRFDPRTAEIGSSLSSVLHEIAYRFLTDPIRHLQWYLWGKMVSLLSWNMIDGWGDIFVYPAIQSPFLHVPLYQAMRLGMLWLHPILMTLGVVGSLVALFRPDWLGLQQGARIAAAMLALMTIYFILLHIIGAPFPRYGVPLRPVMYGLASMLTVIMINRGTGAIRNRTR